MSIVMMPRRTSSALPSGVMPAAQKRIEQPRPSRSGSSVLRRGSREQGRALEMLGHAVEYLVDSRLFVVDEEGVRSDDEAVQIMMRLSRAVFSECPEVISLSRRVRLWLIERLASPLELNQTR